MGNFRDSRVMGFQSPAWTTVLNPRRSASSEWLMHQVPCSDVLACSGRAGGHPYSFDYKGWVCLRGVAVCTSHHPGETEVHPGIK